MIMIVVISHSSATESADLRQAMGSEYDSAYNAWQSETLRFPGIEHGYGKVIEVLDIPSR
jgi:hypothetical protein